MARETLQAWAKRFVAELSIDGEAIPLDRVLRRHLAALSQFRADGLTWTSVADAVRQAGGRRRNGMPFTAAQLRADVSRLSRNLGTSQPSPARSPSVARQSPAVGGGGGGGGSSDPVKQPPLVRAPARPREAPPISPVSDDVSDAELMRVRARLTQT